MLLPPDLDTVLYHRVHCPTPVYTGIHCIKYILYDIDHSIYYITNDEEYTGICIHAMHLEA